MPTCTINLIADKINENVGCWLERERHTHTQPFFLILSDAQNYPLTHKHSHTQKPSTPQPHTHTHTHTNKNLNKKTRAQIGIRETESDIKSQQK